MNMQIELHRTRRGFTVQIPFGRLEEARQFAASEANRRGWSLVNKVTDDVPATDFSRQRKVEA